LHLKNTGSAAAVIYKVEVSGLGPGTVITVSNGDNIQKGANDVTVPAGGEGTILFNILGAPPVAGANYLVKIYTRAGNVYSVTVQAK
jgi:hypothetical protein